MLGIMRYLGLAREAYPPAQLTYLGAFGWSVDQAYGMDKQVVATDAGWDELDEMTEWCAEHGCQCFWDRVLYDQWMCKWVSNGIGGADYLFIQADTEDLATLARLRWG